MLSGGRLRRLLPQMCTIEALDDQHYFATTSSVLRWMPYSFAGRREAVTNLRAPGVGRPVWAQSTQSWPGRSGASHLESPTLAGSRLRVAVASF
jgi:hypothetical protein